MLIRQRILTSSAHQEPDQIFILDTAQQLSRIDELILRKSDSQCRGLFPQSSSSWQF